VSALFDTCMNAAGYKQLTVETLALEWGHAWRTLEGQYGPCAINMQTHKCDAQCVRDPNAPSIPRCQVTQAPAPRNDQTLDVDALRNLPGAWMRPWDLSPNK
jgi:hypothetical protein